MSNEILTCSNCGYETSEVHKETELCQTCKNAYDLGYEARVIGESLPLCGDHLVPVKDCGCLR